MVHHLLNGAVQLFVFAVPLLDRVVVYTDIRVYAVVLDDPITLHIVARKEGHTQVLSVDEWQRAADAYDATPRTRTDQLAQLQGAEAPREEVAVGSRILVDEAHLRAHLHGVGHGAVEGRSAAHRHPIRFAGEALEDHRRNVAATVGTVVDDESLLVELRIEVARELVQPLRTHVGDIDVADLTARSLVHLGDIVLHPLIMVERILVL